MHTRPTIAVNFDNTVNAASMKYRFKKDKLGNQRPAVEVNALVPSEEGIVSILTKGGKGLELLKEAMYDVIRAAIGSDVADNEGFNQNVYESSFIELKDAEGNAIKVPKYSWEGIANQPKEDRRANSIPEELWAEFSKDYLEVMPSVSGKTKDQLENAVAVYVKKFSQIKTNKDVLGKLQTQLALYVEHTKRGEEFSEIIELLVRKLDTYMKSDDIAQLVANL